MTDLTTLPVQLKKCGNSACDRQVRMSVVYCCGPCGGASLHSHEIHDKGPLAHTSTCDQRHAERGSWRDPYAPPPLMTPTPDTIRDLTPAPPALDRTEQATRFAEGLPVPAEVIQPAEASIIHATLDQAKAFTSQVKIDLPQAHAGERCVQPPAGCGQPLQPSLALHFRDQLSRDEYRVTGLCQICQDELFKPSSEEVRMMAGDPEHYTRCDVCGEWRELEFVDVGVGIFSGHDCCAGIRFRGDPGPPSCSRTPMCRFGADHAHGCEPAVPPQPRAEESSS